MFTDNGIDSQVGRIVPLKVQPFIGLDYSNTTGCGTFPRFVLEEPAI